MGTPFRSATRSRQHDLVLSDVELTGDPGDIVLIHPYALHAIAENAGTGPRMMTSKDIYRHGVDQVLPKSGQPSTSTVTTAL
jgi:hypothetical protein